MRNYYIVIITHCVKLYYKPSIQRTKLKGLQIEHADITNEINLRPGVFFPECKSVKAREEKKEKERVPNPKSI